MADGTNERTNKEMRPITPLSDRELEALRLMVDGLDTSQIAEAIGISKDTALNHIRHLQLKVGAKTRLVKAAGGLGRERYDKSERAGAVVRRHPRRL